jgi:hypothetical protein
VASEVREVRQWGRCRSGGGKVSRGVVRLKKIETCGAVCTPYVNLILFISTLPLVVDPSTCYLSLVVVHVPSFFLENEIYPPL